MSKKKEYIGPKVFVAGQPRYDIPVHLFGHLEFSYSDFLHKPTDYRLVVLTGGEDINPAMYGDVVHEKCGYFDIYRDARDWMIITVATRFNIPIVGICRGAQILNVFDGGWLVQHCDNHNMWHSIQTQKGETIYVSSTHHQLMIPSSGGQVLAKPAVNLSTEYYSGTGLLKDMHFGEADVVHFPDIRAIGFQYHPEYMEWGSPAVEYFIDTVNATVAPGFVDFKHRDDYVSLPKPPITKEKLEAEAAYYKSLSKEEKKVFEKKEERRLTLEYYTRSYRALLYSEKEAYGKACTDWAKMLKQMKEQEKLLAEAGVK